MTQHSKDCHGSFGWSADDVTIAVESNFRRRKVRESLEINRHQANLNRDRGEYNTVSWNGFFYKLDKMLNNVT